MHPLDGAFAKVERVKKQLDLLLSDFTAFLKKDAYTIRQERDDETSEYVVFYDCGDLRPPLDWSVRVGEMLYDLRSSLDHFLWQLVLHDRGKPGSHTEFPIFRNPELYRSSERGRGAYKLRGVKGRGRAFIDPLQPYHTRNNPNLLHPLWVLHKLTIIDKHRHLNLTCSLVKLGKFTMQPLGAGVQHFTIIEDLRLEGRAELARFHRYANMKVELPHTIEIAFDDVPIVRRRLVKEVLAKLIEAVDEILIAGRRDLF